MARRAPFAWLIVISIAIWLALLTFAMYMSWPFTRRDLFLAISGELIATGATASFVGPLFRRAIRSFNDLRAHVEATAREYSSFPKVSDYFVRLGSARKLIRIMDTFTFLIEPAHAADFRVSLIRALNNDVRVQILLVVPDSEAADARRRTLADGDADVPADVFDLNLATNLSTLSQMMTERRPDDPGKLEVKLYSIDPAVAYHRIDETSLIAFYPVGARAEDSPQLEVTVASPFGSMVHRRFEEIWRESDTVSLLDYYTCAVHVTVGELDRAFTQVGFVKSGDNWVLVTSSVSLVSALFNSHEARVHWTNRNGATPYRVRHIDMDSGLSYTQAQTAAIKKYGESNERQFFTLIPSPAGVGG